jgi:hypothetical protein
MFSRFQSFLILCLGSPALRPDPERPGWGGLNQWDRHPCLSMTRELFGSRYEYMAELFYCRKLPHWRQDQITYFVTWRLAREQRDSVRTNENLVMTAIVYRRKSTETVAGGS